MSDTQREATTPTRLGEGPSTDLVRALWKRTDDTQTGSPVDCINRLCDEIDRLRAGVLGEGERYEPIPNAWRIPTGAIVLATPAEAKDGWERVYRRVPAEAASRTMDTGLVEVRQVRCPTCGSDDRAVTAYGCLRSEGRVPDPWHSVPPTACPTCRSADRMKRGWMVFDTPCWDPWHSVPPVPVEPEPRGPNTLRQYDNRNEVPLTVPLEHSPVSVPPVTPKEDAESTAGRIMREQYDPARWDGE